MATPSALHLLRTNRVLNDNQQVARSAEHINAPTLAAKPSQHDQHRPRQHSPGFHQPCLPLNLPIPAPGILQPLSRKGEKPPTHAQALEGERVLESLLRNQIAKGDLYYSL
ncbi:hypothetical protein L211DRAFT_246177 [Terfezia boudieri ATCC MYA-4762]|uniref:Uncharacterized protein n=1 Tax=Terfezia boudieri ATCC MYA-4762 TaxID=1051890 RepID=A0A3N4M4L1_9PEZI|nr:hypothetical protein L211DRAFT_246177 [Terfezia boudieri ATCC MYA-4762]